MLCAKSQPDFQKKVCTNEKSMYKKEHPKGKSFPGEALKEILHYVDPTLKDWLFNTSVIHYWVIDLLNNNTNTMN